MKHVLFALLVLATLTPYSAFAVDSYGFSMFFNVPGAEGATESRQYYSKVYATAAECSTGANLSGSRLGLPAGATRDTSKPVVCNCSTPLQSQGASCDQAKFTAAQTTLTTTNTGSSGTQSDSTAFVPLTSIPGIQSAGNAATLPDFLNSLYKLAIGVAAVLAVLQIVRAGVMYMGGDSITEKKDAKNLIALSVGGLILVLSPVIVFSIINPKILSLQIGGLDELASTTPRSDSPSTTDGGAGGTTPPTPPRPEDWKNFFDAASWRSVAGAQLYATTCTDAAISTDLTGIIKNKRPRGPETGGSANATLYSVYCESFSQNFTRFVLGAYRAADLSAKVVGIESKISYVPGDAEKQARFASGCAADGGKLVRDPDLFWSGYGNCSAAVKQSVYTATNTTEETHGINCQQEEYRCVKPDNMTPPAPLF